MSWIALPVQTKPSEVSEEPGEHDLEFRCCGDPEDDFRFDKIDVSSSNSKDFQPTTPPEIIITPKLINDDQSNKIIIENHPYDLPSSSRILSNRVPEFKTINYQPKPRYKAEPWRPTQEIGYSSYNDRPLSLIPEERDSEISSSNSSLSSMAMDHWNHDTPTSARKWSHSSPNLSSSKTSTSQNDVPPVPAIPKTYKRLAVYMKGSLRLQ